MPSRVKLTMKNPRENYVTTGKSARVQIAGLVAERIIWADGLPANWKDMKYTERLRYLQKYIPPDWVMEIFIEPKATRPTRSAFKASLKPPTTKKKLPPQPRGIEFQYRNFQRDVLERAVIRVPARPQPVDPEPPEVVIQDDEFPWHVAEPRRRP